MPGLHQADLGIEQFLLGVQHVEGGARTDQGFLAHAVQGNFVGADLRFERGDARARGVELPPGADHVLGLRAARTVELVASLADQFLGLAHARPFAAVLVDRHRRLHAQAVGVVLVGRDLQVELLLDDADQIDLGQQVADGAVDAVAGGGDSILGADGARPEIHRQRDRLVLADRQSADQGNFAEPAGLLSDGALESRLGDADLRLGLHQVGPGALEPRFGLRHVGDRELADAEAFAGGVELLDEHQHVVTARIGDGDVLHQVGVRGDSRQKDVLLGVGERGPLRLDVGLGRLGVGHRLAAAEQRLDHLQRRETAVQDVVGRQRANGNGVLLDLVVLERERDPRPPVGDGLGERFRRSAAAAHGWPAGRGCCCRWSTAPESGSATRHSKRPPTRPRGRTPLLRARASSWAGYAFKLPSSVDSTLSLVGTALVAKN